MTAETEQIQHDAVHRQETLRVRGLSTQDVSDLYGEPFGASRPSKSTVSRITQQPNHERSA